MEKRFFKIPEFVTYSGLSRSFIYGGLKSGELIATKFGAATRIEKADGDAWLNQISQKTGT